MARLTTSRALVFLLVLTFFIAVVSSHGHAHDEDGHAHVMHEKPSFRYSRQANEPYAGENSPHAGHSHGGHHEHSHGHSDGGHHGHSHGEHGHAHAHDEAAADSKFHSKPKTPTPPRDNVRLWLEALGATLLISLAPFAILFVVRVDNTAEHEPMLKVLLAFASGGLLGDAFLHLIPHAILAQPHEENESHTHGHTHGSGEAHHHDLSVWLWVLVGFCAFLIVEKFVRIVKGPQHHHSHGTKKPSSPQTAKSCDTSKTAKNNEDDKVHQEGVRRRTRSRNDEGGDSSAKAGGDPPRKDEGEGVSALVSESPQKDEGGDKAGGDSPRKLPSEEPKAVDVVAVQPEIKVAGYLNLVADCIHNFTDGLAIGASFLAGEGVGVITTITVLFHEVPHEIGDYAILIQSGCSRKQAMLMQLLTALGALSGTLFSLVAEGVGQLATAWILPFTAGGFIYIAAVSVIPELLENSTVWQSIFEILALMAGVGMMIVIAYFE